MSGTVSMWARDAIVRQIFRGEDLITDCWVALTKTVADANAPGSNLDEPASGYGRVHLPLGSANWGMTGYCEVFNEPELVFPAPTAPWGLIQGYALVTAASGGLTIAVGSLVNPQRVLTGKEPTVQAGGVVFGLFD